MLAGQELPEERYHVVVNGEEQYSIWPEGRALPPGWAVAGFSGSKADCLRHVEQVWTDLRPLSLRRQMESAAASLPASPESPEPAGHQSLLEKLSQGGHPIEVLGLAEAGAQGLRQRVEAGHVRVLFTDTQGGTELGLRFDPQAVDAGAADWDAGKGRLRLAAELRLDGAAVRCAVDIDIERLQGMGRLEILARP